MKILFTDIKIRYALSINCDVRYDPPPLAHLCIYIYLFSIYIPENYLSTYLIYLSKYIDVRYDPLKDPLDTRPVKNLRRTQQVRNRTNRQSLL